MTLNMDKAKLLRAASACLHLAFVFEDQINDPNNIMTEDIRKSRERSRQMWLNLHDEIIQKITAWEEKHGGGRS